MPDILAVIEHEFRRHQKLAEKAMESLDDAQFFQAPAGHPNSIAVIVKHVGGNLISRWTDFLTTDGEKENRHRDQEFIIGKDDTRLSVMKRWEHGWTTLYDSLAGLNAGALDEIVTIRGEPHTVLQALARSAMHVAYHIGQITYLARMLNPDAPWLTIAPGESSTTRGGYLKK